MAVGQLKFKDMSNLSTLPKGDSAWLLRKAIQRVMQQVSVLETNIGASTTGNSANSQVIFNDDGTLRGDPDLIFNTALNKLVATNLEATAALTVGTSATITGDLTVDTSTLKVDSANNRVGIVNASPAAALDIVGGKDSTNTIIGAPLSTVGGGSFANYSELLFKNTSGSNSDASIRSYGNVWNAAGSQLAFFTSNNSAVTERYRIDNTGISTWYVGGTTAMTLNSTGLGVGMSPVSGFNVGATGGNDGDLYFNTLIRNTGTAATSQPRTGILFSGYYIGSTNFSNFAGITGGKENSTSGNSAGFLSLCTAANGGSPTARLTVDSSGNVGVGVTPSAGRGAIQLSAGVGFPATQVASSDANTLDDYEEGSFTPVIEGQTTVGTGTYSIQVGRYTKIGNLVTVQIHLNWTAHTGTGNMLIANLPFTSSGVGNLVGGVSIGYIDNLALSAGNIPLAYVLNANTRIQLAQTPTGGGAVALVPMDTSATIVITGTYMV